MGLRSLFSSSAAAVWRSLADELDARYEPGGFWKGDKLVVPHEEWEITLDTFFSAASELTYSRLRAPYVNAQDFRFSVSRRGFFSDLAVKWFGAQDVVVGHATFDRDFVIKGNDERKLRELFANLEIRALLEAQPEVHFAVQRESEPPKGGRDPEVDELCFVVVGVIADSVRLKQLFDLFAATLDHLCRIGAAQPRAPRRGSRH